MIVDWLVGLLLAVTLPVLQLASFTAPAVTDDLSGMAALGSSLGQANRYLPVDTFLVLIVAGLAFDLVLTGTQFAVWLYRLIPGKAT